jgi:hypothetical protein
VTKSAILDKIEANLAGPPKNEADVVYLLVETRKYLDHIDPEHNKGYEVLRTYCHWSVHVLLDQSGAKTLLRSLDDAFTTKGSDAERGEAVKAAFERFSLVQFRQELRNFLESLRSSGL